MAIELQHLIAAIKACDRNELTYGPRRDLHCFLYNGKWYPCRAVVNHAASKVLERELDIYGSIFVVLRLMPFTSFSDQDMVSNIPPLKATRDEVIQEVRLLSKALNNLVETL